MKLQIRISTQGAILAGRGPQVIQNNLDRFVTQATMFLTAEVKKRTPIKTGNLSRSVLPDVIDKGTPFVKGIIATAIPYALPVETGTGVHGPTGQPITIVPKNGQALFWPGARHPVKKVVIQGMKGAHMFENTLAENTGKLAVMAEKCGLDIVTELGE